MASDFRSLARLVLAVLVTGLAACDSDDISLPQRGTLTPSRATVTLTVDQMVTLGAQPAGPDAQRAGVRVVWQSQDPTVFRLDTVTTAPHVATGRAVGVGRTSLLLTSVGQTVTVPVTVLP